MAAKEKINLLEVIPCRNEHITVEQEGETLCSPSLVLNIRGCNVSYCRKGMSKDIHVHLEEHGTAVWNR